MKIFLKDHIGFFIWFLISFLGLSIFLDYMDGLINNLAYFFGLNFILLSIFMIFRYFRNQNFYKKLSLKPENIEDIMISKPNSILEEYLNIIAQECFVIENKKIEELEKIQNNYKFFIQQSVHQMKTPLSVIDLILQNQEENYENLEMKNEIKKINYQLHQTLEFLRIKEIQNDLHFESIDLRAVLIESINDLKSFFIAKSVFPKLSISNGKNIISDPKWIKVILYQIINNAIKYSYENKNIEIFIQNENVIVIKNYGIGIPKEDIKKIFELFYTGENGRKFGESSGVGLYMVKKICDFLKHDISVESVEKEFTIFKIKV